MLSLSFSACMLGIEGYVVRVEADSSAGSPAFTIIGLPQLSDLLILRRQLTVAWESLLRLLAVFPHPAVQRLFGEAQRSCKR